MSLTDAQRAERRNWIGGSDAAALAGLNPPGWAQPIDVYLDKVGLAPERPSTRMQAMGHLMEDLVATLFTEATGLRTRRPARAVHSRRYPWAGGHLDRWTSDGCVYEGKWGERRDEWGPSLPIGTPDNPTVILAPHHEGYVAPVVPARYALQVQHYLAATDRPLGYLAVLLGYGDFRWYVLHRDEQLIGWLMQLEERFWRDNVLAQVPPAPDGSEAYGRHLRARLAVSTDDELVATPYQQALLDEYRQARAVTRVAQRVEDELAQRLQLSMDAAAKLVFPGGHISWRAGKPALKVEWEPLATALLSYAYGSTAPSADPFYTLSEVMPPEWPTTKKAQAELVRTVARHLGMAAEGKASRPWKPQFDDEQEEGSDAGTAATPATT